MLKISYSYLSILTGSRKYSTVDAIADASRKASVDADLVDHLGLEGLKHLTDEALGGFMG